MTPTIVKLDARDPALRQLIPQAANRIEAHARAHQPEVDAATFAASAIAKVWAGDPGVFLLVFVDPETAALVGHVLAERVGDLVVVAQSDAEPRAKALKFDGVQTYVRAWATAQGLDKVLLSANGDGKQWEKRLGAKFYRHVMLLPLTTGNGHGPDPEAG